MLSDAVPVVEATWVDGQQQEEARYFSFGPRGEHDFYDAADNAASLVAVDAARLHVLVDLMGYTAGAYALKREHIVARHAAPLAVGMLGYPGTVGSPAQVPYAVADRFVAPPSAAGHFAEKLLYLPHTYQFNNMGQQWARTAAEGDARASLVADEFAPGVFVYAHFNGLRKVDRRVFGVWMNVLRRTRRSVLWLLKMPADAVRNLHDEAAAFGISKDRLVFGEPLPHRLHLRRCARADLFLDSLHYNAHTTATDALWAGVPVLTFPGQMMQSRVAAGLALAAGLPDTVVASLEEYEDLAVELAGPEHALR